jgi:hypothetical protein
MFQTFFQNTMCVCLLLQNLVQSCLRGGGGRYWRNTIVLTTKSVVPTPVPVSRSNTYSGGALARALPEGLRYSLAELRQPVY